VKDAAEATVQRSSGTLAGLRPTLEAVPAGLLVIDAEGTIHLANTRVQEIFGHGPKELVGRPCGTILPGLPASIPCPHPPSLRCADDSAAADLDSWGRPRSVSGIRKDGSRTLLEIRVGALATDDGCFALALVFEVSKQTQVERERDRIFALTRDLVIVTGPGGILERVNPAVVAAMGFSEEELIGHAFLDFIHVEDRAAALERYRARLRGVDVPVKEVRCLCKDGSSRVILWSSTYDADRDRTYAVGHDITDRTRKEEALRQATLSAEAANKELEAFSDSVSHDLRAPLRIIEGFSRALLEDSGDRLDDVGRAHLERVRRASRRMSDLIDDLLKLSRIARHELKLESVDLSSLVHDAIEELREREPHRRVAIDVASGVVARGDAGLLDVALRNLVENAWKYTSKCETAEIEFGRAFVDGEAAFLVRDNGVGFDMAHADRLFGAFQRLHDERAFPGNGIGLATVQRIVNLHGGRLWARSAVDEGAEFGFTLGPEAGRCSS